MFISWWSLLWCLVPVSIVATIYVFWSPQDLLELIYACLRMVIQLALVGFVLIWLFDSPSALISLGVITFMLSIAAWIAIRPLRKLSEFSSRSWFGAVIALITGVGICLSITMMGILPVKPWFKPSFLIPLAGMYLANSMNVISLSAERYFAERRNVRDKELAKRRAFNASMIPQINGLFAVGLVALPGMMTGQIISGVEPMIAVRYQIMIMAMLLGSTGIAACIMLIWLSKNDV
ncbi:ABC transporter permease [Alteromonas sp. ASW11-130]|uniref:ABC transporter permease n=1 Tax=Alteromonas sp. ASW11-130 TaxID=3015775 RepID=UPI002241FC25|nr:ABC transporter permease [Alteromonas sp. ASW11-130]MCW8092193.1 ABC transporter permease [Alteromonas sp. ASW11-130]